MYSSKVYYDKKMTHVWGFAEISSLVDVLETNGYSTKILDGSSSPVNNISAIIDEDNNPLLSVEFVKREPGYHIIRAKVGGMSCASCARSIETAFTAVRGIKLVRVALISQKVEITADIDVIDIQLILDKITGIGYTARLLEVLPVESAPAKELRLKVIGKNLSQEVMSDIERSLLNLNGVKLVNFQSSPDNLITVLMAEYTGASEGGQSAAVGPRDIVDFLTTKNICTELAAISASSDVEADSDDLKSWTRLLCVSLLLGLPVTALHTLQTNFADFKVYLDEDYTGVCRHGVTLGQSIMLVLNFPLQFGVGYKFYRSAFLGALHGHFGMDCLVVAGTTVTFVYSIVQICFACITAVRAKHVFFEASGMLLMFVTLGKFLESYAKGKTLSAINRQIMTSLTHTSTNSNLH